MASKHERHAKTKWEWGSEPGRSDELRQAVADDPQPPPRPPGKKDKRRWCKGKTGVEHTPGVVMNHYGWVTSRFSSCAWVPMWEHRQRERVVGWRCCHHEVCTRCGKILRQTWEMTAEECPTYPGTPEQRAAAEVKLAEEKAWRAAHPTRYRRKPAPDGPTHYRRPRKDTG